MPKDLVAAAAFFALGANVLGTGLLLLFNIRGRAVRWYALFSLAIIVWLFAQGWINGMGFQPWLRSLHDAAVHLMPAFFLCYTLVQVWNRRTVELLGVIALGLGTLLVMEDPLNSPVTWVWQGLMWGAAATVFGTAIGRARGPKGQKTTTGQQLLEVLLMVVIPISVIGGFLSSGRFFLLSMPLITVLMQFLIFLGVLRHRFYDIEVRAARSGELASRAAEQERLAVLGELAASVAHEVRNPLTGVRSLTQRLAEEEIDPERRRRYTGVILEEVGRIERIVSNLLSFARREPAPGSAVGDTGLAPLFEDLLLLLESRARRAGVALDADPGGLTAPAPREPLAQALLNLLINALEHSPRGGRVSLRAAAADGGVDIVVRDQGPGVPPAERERIFEPFHSLGGGTGLGLAVVRRLARQHGWSATLADPPGGGAEFRLHIGGARPAAAAPRPAAAMGASTT